nr:MAG TPA: hypothetical protein [Caudoviricetes sp.]DAM49003.1 MAG TPA: hypothetical protein [Caudoviricetes sp.]DAR21385.1 MAG TPA: hypothetical protein [Caudoviricetes sp.]
MPLPRPHSIIGSSTIYTRELEKSNAIFKKI